MKILLVCILAVMVGKAEAQNYWLPIVTTSGFLNPTNQTATFVEWDFYDYYTNGGVATLTNRNAAKPTYNLLNQTTANFPTAGTNVNGFGTVLFNATNSTYLLSTVYTSGPPHEVMFVVNWNTQTNNNSQNAYFMDSTNAAFATEAIYRPGATGPGVDVNAGGGDIFVDLTAITNKWLIFNVAFDTSTITVYTNGVQAVTASTTVNPSDGFTMGTDLLKLFPASFLVAKFYDFPLVLTAPQRANDVGFLKQRYGTGLFP